MSRIRTIKPEFFTSESVVDLTPLARLFFIGLWCEADREGRFEWKPRSLKMRYLPSDSCDIDEIAQSLVDAGLVVLYGEGKFAFIPKFSKHQVIPHREAQSRLPEPSVQLQGNCSAVAVQLQCNYSADALKLPGGREGKGRECKPLFDESNESPESSTEKSPGEVEFSEPFLRFWSAYPARRRTAKPKCFAIWKRQKLDSMISVVLADLSAKGRTDDWTKANGEYVPAPLTYLNQGRWADSLPDTPRPSVVGGVKVKPEDFIGPEALAAIRLAGGPGFAHTLREHQQVVAKAKELGWKE